MRSFLISNGLDINATQEEKYEFVINIASEQTRLEEITEWLASHTIEQKKSANIDRLLLNLTGKFNFTFSNKHFHQADAFQIPRTSAMHTVGDHTTPKPK